MQFNISKCVHLPITNKIKPSSNQYSLFGHHLSKVASHSIVHRSKIRFQIILGKTHHRNYLKMVNKSRMVKRPLVLCKPEVKYTAYNMLVRPKLEYASPIWNPHTSSQINHLERIQHYAARFVANDHRRKTSPTTLVQTLERRRIIIQAMTFYKIIIITLLKSTHLQAYSNNHTTDTITQYLSPRSRLNTVVYSFYPRAIRIWNTIPKVITEIKQPESSGHKQTPFHHPNSSKMLLSKPHPGTQHHTLQITWCLS